MTPLTGLDRRLSAFVGEIAELAVPPEARGLKRQTVDQLSISSEASWKFHGLPRETSEFLSRSNLPFMTTQPDPAFSLEADQKA